MGNTKEGILVQDAKQSDRGQTFKTWPNGQSSSSKRAMRKKGNVEEHGGFVDSCYLIILESHLTLKHVETDYNCSDYV